MSSIEVVDKKGVGARLRAAHIYLMSQEGERVTLSDLAERMSEAHGSRTFAQSQITDYQLGNHMPPIEAIWAYAQVTGVDPGWIAFGVASMAPGPGYARSMAVAESLPEAPLEVIPRQRKAAKKGKRA